MDPTALLPTPDAIPAPWGWFQGLLLLCFLVHLLLMNAMFGSACIALLSHLLQRNAATPCSAPVSQTLPSLIAFTVNFGVAPLLFVQVLYGHLIYASSLLMAVYWLAVVGLLMAAYGLAYLLKYQGQRRGWLRVPMLLMIVSLFATIAFVFVNNIGMMQAPASWGRYFEAPRGLLLNLSDPMHLPRYLHFVLASVAVGGLSIAGYCHWQQQRGDWSGADWVRRGCRWFSLATMANILVGLWFFFTLPPGTVELSSAEGRWLTISLAAGLVLSLPAIRLGLAGKVVGATLWTLATVVVMVGARELLRRALLAPWFSPAQLPVQPELLPMVLFLIIFVLGLGLIGWMVSFTRRNGNQVKGGQGMNYPVWQLDSLGGGLLIILIAVFHVYISHFAVGGGLFLVLAERKADRERNPAMFDYVRGHAKFFLLLTMVAGSISGVGIWFIISLLNPAATSILIHTFVWGWATEWVFFLVEIVSLLLYTANFGRMSGRHHRVLGWIYCVSAWMSLFLINGIIDFMLTPGTWPQDGRFWSGFFNPSFWPSLAFRTFLCLIIAGLFGLVTATWLKEARLRTTMVRFCARWLLLPFVLFVASAWWYVLALAPELRELIFARMPAMRPFFNGLLIGSPILLLAGLLLIFRLPVLLSRPLALVLLLIGQLYIGCFEFVREGARRPYIIRDVMYSTSILPKDLDRMQEQGVLSQARWVRHRDITPENRLETGRELYNLLCLSCHAIDGPIRDIKPLTKPFTPSGLDAFIAGMHLSYPAMPPFAGTAKERAALAAFIAEGLNKRHDPAPVTLMAKEIEVPAFDQENAPYLLLAWSPTGMRHLAEVKGLLSLLPPGNELRAQLIKRGEMPEIVNQGVEMRWRLDGAEPASPFGEMMAEEDQFIAKGIELRPEQGGVFDPYPVLRIEARDEQGTLLAATKVVAPVSTEVGCSSCHGDSPELGGRPGLGRDTGLHILAVHDRLSGTQLLPQAQGGTMVRCQSCHADALTKSKGEPELLNLSAALHGFHTTTLKEQGARACNFCHPASSTGHTRMLRDIHGSMGMDCTSCHGVLEDQALGLLKEELQQSKQRAKTLMQGIEPQAVTTVDAIKPRRPWVQQPDCLHCHVNYQAPDSDTLIQAWTKDEQGLYRQRTDDSGRLACAACHGSAHAVYPADNPYGASRDVLQPLQYQGNRLPMGANRNCKLCHTVDMEDEMHHNNSLRDFRNE